MNTYSGIDNIKQPAGSDTPQIEEIFLLGLELEDEPEVPPPCEGCGTTDPLPDPPDAPH